MESSEVKAYMRSNLKIVEFAIKKWRLLLIVGIISGAFAAVFTDPHFIPPKYTSRAVIYPANLGEYSDETELEQMQQYLESNAIRDYIIGKFNLYDDFEVDSTSKESKSKINKAYNDHVSFDETRFESIEITATSIDPVKARDIVNEIIHQLDETIRRTERKKYKEVVDIAKRMVDEKQQQMDSLEQKIREISTQHGILDYIAQSERVTEKYMDFLLSGKKGKDYEEAKALYENLEKYGRKFHDYHAQLNEANGQYMQRLNYYEYALKDLEKYQTYSNVLVSPEVPDKKSSPMRLLIVLTAMAASVGFTFVLLLVFGYQNR